MWCFTVGVPSAEVITSFSRALAMGNLQWVIIPIETDGFYHLVSGEFVEPDMAPG